MQILTAIAVLAVTTPADYPVFDQSDSMYNALIMLVPVVVIVGVALLVIAGARKRR